mmetsp:Transcript_56331/g.163409  ORF Transcript_56331/g.163409 Transcript_56331/m.163409 type:complete len:246 (+) Transcript_56331:154-891(+)
MSTTCGNCQQCACCIASTRVSTAGFSSSGGKLDVYISDSKTCTVDNEQSGSMIFFCSPSRMLCESIAANTGDAARSTKLCACNRPGWPPEPPASPLSGGLAGLFDTGGDEGCPTSMTTSAQLESARTAAQVSRRRSKTGNFTALRPRSRETMSRAWSMRSTLRVQSPSARAKSKTRFAASRQPTAVLPAKWISCVDNEGSSSCSQDRASSHDVGATMCGSAPCSMAKLSKPRRLLTPSSSSVTRS